MSLILDTIHSTLISVLMFKVSSFDNIVFLITVDVCSFTIKSQLQGQQK